MDAREILDLYDRQMRADPPKEAGVDHVWVDGVLRSLGGDHNLIGWWDLPAEAAPAAAAREAAWFQARGQSVEWKLFSHDHPLNLAAHLAAAGFEGDEPETFLGFDQAAAPLDQTDGPGVTVLRVVDAAGLADLMVINALAFGRPGPRPIDTFAARLQEGSSLFYIAYADGVPACAGRMDLAPGRAFAGLYGGGTVPGHRGRGLYRALVAARAREAARLGVRFLTVDARETSRPILERLGFKSLASVRGWVLTPG